ncbi:hypothetical protein FACS1894129_1410 [Actinomycetota bacterium]|nr:hypothetical protein FACS1894129_1410 [Actinomycetota bacterium]
MGPGEQLCRCLSKIVYDLCRGLALKQRVYTFQINGMGIGHGMEHICECNCVAAARLITEYKVDPFM